MSEPTQNPHFLSLSSLLPDGVFLADRDGHITYVSEKAGALFGQPARELVGRHFGALLHPSDRELAGHALQQAAVPRTGPLQMDLRMLGPGGRPFVGRVRVRLTAEGLTGMVHDVTAADEEQRRLQDYRNYRDRGLALLYLFTVDMASLPPDANIHAFIARGLKEFTGARFVTMSEYDPAVSALRHRHYEVDAGVLGKVITLLGSRVEDLFTPVTDEMVAEVMASGWIRIESLYDAAFGSIPRPVAAAIQQLLGIDRLIALSFVYGGRLYGTSLIALLPGEPDPPLEVLQAFRHTAAIALRCRALENARPDGQGG